MLMRLIYSFALLFFVFFQISCHQLACNRVLFEFKAAYFRPTNSCVREIYGHGGAIYGPEVTFQLCQNSCWYGFASINFLSKHGHSIGACDRTKLSIMPLAFGAKYFVPSCCGDFYVGLGFQPIRLKTTNCSPFVIQKTSKWGVGGIAKFGLYSCLTPCIFLDLFIDYSFTRVNCNKCFDCTIPLKVRLDGVLLGAGLGYKFN